MCWTGIVGLFMLFGGWSLLKNEDSIGLVRLVGFFIIIASGMLLLLGLFALVGMLSSDPSTWGSYWGPM
jgi:hypothetical protein